MRQREIRGFALRSEANLDAELTILAIVKGAEGWRRDIGLHVGGHERTDHDIGSNADPRSTLPNREAVLYAEVDISLGGKSPIVPVSHVTEPFIDDRVRQTAPPVEHPHQQPVA